MHGSAQCRGCGLWVVHMCACAFVRGCACVSCGQERACPPAHRVRVCLLWRGCAGLLHWARSHGIVWACNHGIVWACSHGIVWACSHGIVWACSHGIMWACSHGIVWACNHGIVWACSHGIVWACSHGIVWAPAASGVGVQALAMDPRSMYSPHYLKLAERYPELLLPLHVHTKPRVSTGEGGA